MTEMCTYIKSKTSKSVLQGHCELSHTAWTKNVEDDVPISYSTYLLGDSPNVIFRTNLTLKTNGL